MHPPQVSRTAAAQIDSPARNMDRWARPGVLRPTRPALGEGSDLGRTDSTLRRLGLARSGGPRNRRSPYRPVDLPAFNAKGTNLPAARAVTQSVNRRSRALHKPLLHVTGGCPVLANIHY